MLRLHRVVFEEVDVGLLGTADDCHRFIENKLFCGQGAGSDVKPAVLECALDDAHGHAGGQPEKPEAHGSTGTAAMSRHRNGIENHSSQSRADNASQNSITDLGGG